MLGGSRRLSPLRQYTRSAAQPCLQEVGLDSRSPLQPSGKAWCFRRSRTPSCSRPPCYVPPAWSLACGEGWDLLGSAKPTAWPERPASTGGMWRSSDIPAFVSSSWAVRWQAGLSPQEPASSLAVALTLPGFLKEKVRGRRDKCEAV